MYTTIYTEAAIASSELKRAFAVAVGSSSTAVAVVASDVPGGAADAWGDPAVTTAVQYWTVPGEFPFAAEALIKPPFSESEGADLPILRRVAADLHAPVIVPQDLARVLAIFPDGSTLLLDEADRPSGAAIALGANDRKCYERHLHEIAMPV